MAKQNYYEDVHVHAMHLDFTIIIFVFGFALKLLNYFEVQVWAGNYKYYLKYQSNRQPREVRGLEKWIMISGIE